MKPYTAHYIASSHWDREWYQPFQDFRLRLIQVMDGVLDVLEADERFAAFHTDGQTAMLKDYLEIRPENRERVVRLAQAGRLLVGPWRVLPDEMLVSGEALIRSLLVGHRECQGWGIEAIKFGYLCDMFGHISQMPQILNGFAIDAALLGRGTNEHSHPAHFIWEAPDGSRVLTYKLPDAGGYGALTTPVRRYTPASAFGQAPDHLASPGLDERLRAYLDHEKGRTRLGLIMLIDGLDHQPIMPQAPELLERLRSLDADVEVLHSSLPRYAEEMRRRADRMPVFRGELRDTARQAGGYLYLISNCLSSRYPLKQANDANQTLLERWAEPFLAWANLRGARHLPATLLDVAWNWTLDNQPHDSICGCSVDQVHKDMEYRFDQARLIGEGVCRRALDTLLAGEPLALAEKSAFQVALAQAEPYPRREVAVFDIAFPPTWEARFHEGFIGERKNSFRLFDAEGREVRYQLLSLRRDRTTLREQPDSRVAITPRDICTLAAEVDLPPLGYTTLEVRPATGPVRVWGTLRNGPLSAENEHLAVSVNSNGTIRLTDKATGRTYDQLLTFVDDGEVGDGWFHISPIADEAVTSLASPCDAGQTVDGPLMVTFRLHSRLRVPECFDWAAGCRSQTRSELAITTDVTLKKGARALEVQTTVENCVRDHRLRLLLPSGLAARTWWVDLPFDLVERTIALDPAGVDDKELPVPEKNMLAVAAIAEAGAGLAFVSAGGLHEAAVHDDAARTLAVTLLRGFQRPIATDGQPGGQILGRHTFCYALAPLAGPQELPRLLHLRDRLATGLRVRQTEDGLGVTRRTESLVRIEPEGVHLSALKPAGDGRGLILRLYNPGGQSLTCTVTTAFPIANATFTNLNEEDDAPLKTAGHTLALEVPGKRIVTVRVVPGEE